MLTNEQQTAIAEKLASMHLPSGLGDEENACSIAAINLALTGELTDGIPDCMSVVIGKWIITTQDNMPDEMRNSDLWKSLLPLAAGTGRDKEQERLKILLDWMWGTALPVVQPLADAHGFGTEWSRMSTERTAETAWAAARAAARAAALPHEADRAASWAAAVQAAEKAADAAWVADRAGAASWVADGASEAAERAASWAAATGHQAWDTFDPPALLDRLIRA